MARLRHLASFTLVALLALAGPLACQKSFEDRLAEARELQERGDFAASVGALRELAAEQPDQAEVSHRLGLALASTGEVSAALWPLRKAAESPEFAVESGLMLSRLLQQTNNYDEAIAAAKGVLEVEPENVAALSHLARAQILGKKYKEGLETADRVVALDALSPRAHWLRGAALAELERPEESVAAYTLMRSTAAEAGEVQLVLQACTEQARILDKNLEQGDAAEKLLESCIEENPGAFALVKSAAQLLVERDRPERAEALWREAVEQAPDSLELRRGLAQHLAAQERWDEAITVLDQAVDDFGTIEATAALAELHLERDDYAGAEAALADAATRLGDSDPLRFQRADLLLEQGELERAEELAASIEDPVRRDAIVGRLLFFREDYEGSLEALNRAAERWPDNAGIRYIAGRARQALGDDQGAIADYRTAMRADLMATDAALAAAYLALAIGEPAEALQYIQYHVKSRPYRNAEPYVIGARAAALSGNAKAVADLLSLLAEQEGGLPAAVAERARIEMETDVSKAIDLVNKSELDLAAAENEAVLELQSQLLVDADRAGEALALIERTIAARPDAAVPHALRVRTLQALDRGEDAKLAADEALAAHPDSAPVLAAAAELELAAGRLEEAVALFDRASAADERDVESPYRAAQIEYAAGRSDEARDRLAALLSRAPAHVGASNDLAYLLAEQGSDLDRALDLAQRAARLSALPEVVDTLATVRIARGEESVAKEILEKALAANPDSGTLRYRLGVALERGGDSDGALGSFRQALEAGTFPEREAAQAEIARLESTRTVQ